MTQYIKRLPEVFQTVTEKKFFDATFDQVFSKKDSDLLAGYLGRRNPGSYNPITDFYLPEPSKNRTWWQLEATAYARDTDNNKTNVFFYEDMLDHIEYYGGNTLNQDRLFESQFYSFGPPIDYDMFTNYHNYYWVEQGLPTIEISGVFGVDIIGKASYTTPETANPPNFTLSTGMTISLLDDAGYSTPHVVENFGNCIGIGLTNKYSDLTIGTTYEFLPWDGLTELSTGRIIYNENWDMTTWEVQAQPGNGDYITIERGAIDRNAWSRTNKWFHIDVITQTVSQTSSEFPSNATRALRPIIQFVADILLYKSGTQYRDTINIGFTNSSLGIPLTLADFQGKQVSELDYTYDIQLVDQSLVCWFNDPATNNYIYVANVQTDGSVFFTQWTSAATPILDGDILFFKENAPDGGAQAGQTWYYESGTWQQIYSEKLSVNQPPMFVLQDHNNVSLDDPVTYPESSFRGSKIFSYKVSTETGATVDPVLKFPIVYTSLGQASDIVFQNDLITTRYTYNNDLTPIDGYYYYNVTTKPALYNSWNLFQPAPCDDTYLPPNYEFQVATAGQTAMPTRITTVPNSGNSAYLAVFVNGVFQVNGVAYTVTDIHHIDFTAPLQAGDHVSMYSYEVDASTAPRYESVVIPAAQVTVSTTVNLTAGIGGKSYTLVYVNGVYQAEVAAYNITGPNELTFVAPLAASDNVTIYSYADIPDIAPGYKSYSATSGQTSLSTTVEFSSGVYSLVYVNGVYQAPEQAYNVSGPNQLTFVAPLAAGDSVSVYFYGKATGTDCGKNIKVSKQRVIDKYVVGYGTDYQFKLSVTPYGFPTCPDIVVSVNGVEVKNSTEQTTGYTMSTINNRIYVDLSSYLTLLLTTTQSQPPVVEIQTYTHGPLDPEYSGYSEIPQQLEANPNQLEVSDISGSNLTEHFASIIENQSSFTGVAYGGTNNYRDTRKNRSVGSYILQNVAPALKSMLVSSSDDLGFIAGVRFSEDEYTKFKNKFVSAATQLINQGFSPVQVYNNTVDISAWVGEILKVLNVSKEFSNAFAYSYMAAQGTPYASETFAVNGSDLITLTDYADLTDPRNGVYIYDLTDPLNERILTVGVDYEIVSTNLTIEIQLLLGATPVSLYTALYKNPLPIYVPSTPTKLGLYGSYIPRIELDTSYAIPANVIVGHDGSKTIAYNDYRDNLLLDLETRIYNFLQTRYRDEYYLPVRIESVLPGKFRKTRYSRDEYLNVTESYLNKWCSKNRANYRVNDWESASLVTPVNQLWKLYNYRNAVTVTGEITDLQGNWKGIFQHYYDTYYPDTRPWEMLGFSQEPSWWRTEYGAPTTNAYGQDVWTSTAAGNNVMWDDLEAGIIRQGPSAVYDWASQTPMAQEMWARPGLSAFIPVDTAGEIIPIIDLFGLAYTGNPYEPFDHYDDAWVYGDGGPVEQAWMSTSGYRFSLQEFMFLMRPGPYGELMWDTLGTTRSPGLVEIPGVAGPVMTNTNWQYVQNDVFSYEDDFFAWFRPKNIDQIVHAEIVDGITSVRFGYQSWISDRILFLGKDISDTFGQKVRTLDVNLANKVAGFINKDTTNTYISAITPGATTNTLIIPSDNFEVFLHKSPVIDTYAYSGIIIRALADGTFAVYGYDLLNAEFITLDRSTQKLIDVSIGGTPAEFRYFERNATYQAGEYVRYNGVYYVSNAVQTVAKFDDGSWDKLSALPTEGGISVSYKPYSLDTITKYAYGSVLKTPQAVFDLMIGWGAYLESQGWKFEDVNQDTNILNNWLSSAKQFLFWVNTSWAPDASIQLSPLANSATLVVDRGYPNDVETISNGVYSILDKYGVAISPQNTTTDRDGRSITVAPASLSSGGIYFLQVNTSETEHVLVFDNETSFGDTVYSPLLRSRQQRLRFYGFRSNGWYGKMEAPGYLVIDDQLVPNYDSIVNAMRYYYDANVTIDNQSLEDLGRHLIGYESKSYLDNLEVENDVQYLFYQGAIRQKGTKQAIEKLFRSTKIQNDEIIKIYEEWALKLGDFGNTIEQVSTEFKVTPEQNTGEVIVAKLNFVASTVGFVRQVNILNAENIYTRIPTLVFPKPDATPVGAWTQWTPTGIYQIGDIVQYPDVFGNPVYRVSNVDQGPSATFVESNWTIVLATRIAKAYVVLDNTNRISRVDITDPGYGYLSAPAVTISSGSDLNSLDKLYTVWQGEIVSDETLDNVINIDIDDIDVWVQRPTDPEIALEFPVTDVVDYTLPNAGYVHFDDIDLYSFDVNQTAINWQDLNPVREDTLWVAKTFTEDWDVLKLVDISQESGFDVVSDPDGQLFLRTLSPYLITPQFIDGLHGNDFGNLLSLQVIGAKGYVEIDGGRNVRATATALVPYTAVATANIIGGSVSGFAGLIGGAGYTFVPTVDIDLPPSGTAAKAIAVVEDGVVTDIVITSPGSGYTVAPTVTIEAPDGAGTVFSIQITDAGSSYTVPPTVTITGDGLGATATATINDGNVISINVEQSGVGYTTASVVLSAPTGPGVVTDVVITQAGANYAAPPVTTIVTNLGNFPAIATVAGGNVTSVSIPEITGVVTEATLYIAPPVSVGSSNNYVVGFDFNEVNSLDDPTYNYYNLVTLDGAPIYATDIPEYAEFTNLLLFKSMRFLNLGSMFDDNPRWDTVLWDSNLWDSGLPSYLNIGDKVWVDGYDELSMSAPNWGVFTVWYPSIQYPNGLIPFRAQEPLINTSLFESASVFNDSGTELVQLPVYDPFKYILPAAAKQNLSYVALQDPARYNVASEARLLSSNTTFGEQEVGRLWWDLSETRYVYYEQPVALDGSETEASNLTYRRDHWAQLFPGSVVAIYEWVKSDVPPSEYTGSGIPRSEKDYVQITTSNRFTNITVTSYYFWVLGSTNMPSNANRTLAATRVASLLQSPKKQGFTFFSPLQQTSTNNSYMFYNVQEILAYQGDNVQVKYRLAERNDQEHTQWSFFREGDKTSLVADQFWDKMVDSLCGYTRVLPMSDEYANGIIVAKNLPWDIYGWDVALWDEATDTLSAEYGEVLPVPDPTLSEAEKYGIMYRPRQGMFVKLYQARKIFVQSANELLKHIPIRDDNPSWDADVKTDTYWEYTNWYKIGYEDVMPTIVYRTLLEANTALTAGNLEVGTILQVIDGTIDGRYVLYEVVQVNPNVAALSLEEVAVEASAIKLLDTLYTAQNKYGLSVELRQLLNAFRDEVMINANVVDQNEVFFSMLNYVISEQKAPDWVFKTSYIYIKEDNVPLTQSTLYVPDQIDNIIDYITDIKPYHTKIRDYSTTYTISDIAVGTASDSYKWALTLTFGPNGAEDISPDHNTFDSNPAVGWDYKRGDVEIPWDYTLTSGPGVTSVGTVVTVESTADIYPGMMVSVVAGVGEFVDNTYVTRILSETSFSISTTPLVELTGELTEIEITMPWDTTYDASFIDQFISRNAVDAPYQPPTPDGIWPGFDENYIEVQLTYFDASKIGYSELFPYTFDFNGLNLNGPQTFITPSDVISIRVGDVVLNYGEDYYVEYNPEDVNYTVYFYNNPGTSPMPVAIVWLDGGAIQESYVNGYRNELAIGTSEGDMVINVDTKLPVDVSTGVATPYTGWGDTWEVIDGPVAEILLDASVGGEAEIPWDVVPELELLSYIISSKENVNRKDGAHFYRNSEVASGQLVFDVGTPTAETDNLTEITVFVDPAIHPDGTDILPTPADGYPGVIWIDGERIEYKYKGLVAPDTWELKLVRRGTMGTAANSHPALVPQVDEVNTGPAGETIYVTPTTLVPNRVWVERANSIPGSAAGPNRDIWNVYSLPAVPNPGSAQSLTAYTDVENVPIGGLWYARTPEANFLVQGMGKSIP